jgi:dihydrofolate reductase
MLEPDATIASPGIRGDALSTHTTHQRDTTFYFVDGVEDASQLAREAAEGEDTITGGGAPVIQQFMRAGFIDERLVAVVPVWLGSGGRLFDNLADVTRNYLVKK